MKFVNEMNLRHAIVREEKAETTYLRAADFLFLGFVLDTFPCLVETVTTLFVGVPAIPIHLHGETDKHDPRYYVQQHRVQRTRQTCHRRFETWFVNFIL